MGTLPIAWLASVLMMLAAYLLAWNTRVPGRSRLLLCAFFTCLVIVTALLGMRLSFDWLWPARAQPFVAILAAPLAYLGFLALTQDNGPKWNKILLRHAGLVAFVLTGLAAPIPISADVFILAINCFYLVLLAALMRYGSDNFSSVPPHATSLWRLAVYATIALLGLMIATDGLVFAIGIVASSSYLTPLLNGVSGLFAGVVLIATLIGVPLIVRASHRALPSRGAPTQADYALIQALDKIMKDKELYRDSNLTLARVAKRLAIPARDLSGAINRVTNENFSRCINGYRIAHVRRTLTDTHLPITEVMFEAGFLSKSNFNTEFRRNTGVTPSQFRTSAANKQGELAAS